MAVDDYNARRLRELDEQIASLRPGIAKCAPTPTDEQRDIALMAALGVDDVSPPPPRNGSTR